MKKVNERILKAYLEITGTLKQNIRSERGSGLIVGLIFGAILILAVLALDAPVRAWAAATWTRFTTWINGRLDALFT